MTKQEAINWAAQLKWTKADAKRAFENINCQEADERELLLALVKFAGPALNERQKSQGSYKGKVTQRNNQIKKIEEEYAQYITEAEHKINELNSTYLPVIEWIYNWAKPFGLKDPWIEAMLATYHQQKAS